MNYLELYNEFAKERERLTNKDSKVLIVDGLNRFISVWSAVPALNNNGEHIGGIAGFLKSLGLMIRQTGCTRCIVVFDGKGGSQRRRKIFSGYKNNRTPTKLARSEFATMEEEQYSMRKQMLRILEYLSILPITVLQVDNIEADDTIANLITSQYENTDNQIIVASTDRDFLQLVNERISVYNPVKKKTYTPAEIQDELGILSENYLTYRVFTGDSSDNIPGVKGLGIKTMIKEFALNDTPRSIHDIINLAEEKSKDKKSKKIFNEIICNRDKIQLNFRIMQLKDSDISLHSKNQIRDGLNQPIEKSDRFLFLRFFAQDNLHDSFKDIDRWLRDTFDTLDYWSDK